MTDIFNSLTHYIKQFPRIYIMTHKNPDLDGLGSSICLYTIAKEFKKECYIIGTNEENNSTVNKMYELLDKNGIEIEEKKEKEALKSVDDDTLLVILDVHKIDRVESPKLLEKSKNVIVLDHHIKGNNYIKATDFCYINSGLSSVTELMAYYLKYLNKVVDPILATIMITGIEIDTNNYRLKTTEKTYAAGAILTAMGADPIVKQELLKEDKDSYLRRSSFVRDSYMINENMALCTMDEELHTTKELAEIAEELLQFDGVEASFTIGKLKENIIGISARSLGNIDVESIMGTLGGGGHLNNAATQLDNATIEEAKKQLLDIINQDEKRERTEA